MSIHPYAFDFIGATKMNSPEVNTFASLFTNSDENFTYKGSIWKVAFSWRQFMKGGIFGLYLRISGPFAIHITLLVANQMVSADNFKLSIYLNASD